MCFHFCFCFLVDNSLGIMSSATGLKIYVITAGIKKYKPVIKNRGSLRK